MVCFFRSEQKWSKGKVRDKLNNLVLFDKATYDKLCKEVPNYKLITPAVVSERLKIRGSLARAALQELLGKGKRSELWENTGLLELGISHPCLTRFHAACEVHSLACFPKATAFICISKALMHLVVVLY